jgi:hypothetical protein
MASVLAECSHEAKQFFVLLALAAQRDVDYAIFEQEQSETVRDDAGNEVVRVGKRKRGTVGSLTSEGWVLGRFCWVVESSEYRGRSGA